MFAQGTLRRDPNFSKVKSLLHFDGANGGTVFTDVKGLSWSTLFGSPQTITSGPYSPATSPLITSRFGSSYLYLGGPGVGQGAIQSAASSSLSFGAGDYTVQGWVMPVTPITNFGVLFDNRSATNAGIGIYGRDTSGTVALYVYNNASLIGSNTSTLLRYNVWNHWCVCRSGTTLYAGINGTVVSAGTDARTLAATPSVTLGSAYNASQSFYDYMDETEILVGIALYTSNYTVPTAPFPSQ
jgi:hypothetical protein